jgi:hypothetical protein
MAGCTRPLMTPLLVPERAPRPPVAHRATVRAIPVVDRTAKLDSAGALIPVRVERDGHSYFPVSAAVLQAASRPDGSGQRALAAFGEVLASQVLKGVEIPGLGRCAAVTQNPTPNGIDLIAEAASGQCVVIEVKSTSRTDPREILRGRGSAAGLRQGGVDYNTYQASLTLSREEKAAHANWRDASARVLVSPEPALFMVFHVPTSRMIIFQHDGVVFEELHTVELRVPG